MHCNIIVSPDAGPLWIDGDGYLIETDFWTRNLARLMAKSLGVYPLENVHWRVIDYVRERYFNDGSMPSVRRICLEVRLEGDDLSHLFVDCHNIRRIAGLPATDEEVSADV